MIENLFKFMNCLCLNIGPVFSYRGYFYVSREISAKVVGSADIPDALRVT